MNLSTTISMTLSALFLLGCDEGMESNSNIESEAFEASETVDCEDQYTVIDVCDSCTLTFDWTNLSAEHDGSEVDPTSISVVTLALVNMPPETAIETTCDGGVLQENILAIGTAAAEEGETTATIALYTSEQDVEVNTIIVSISNPDRYAALYYLSPSTDNTDSEVEL